jgi:uncharacterized membrane protein YeaQ/YmgE (transglycosylase-associated protein family)
MRPVMSVRMRILFGLAIGAIAGFVTGKWGSGGGIAAMLAGVVGAGLAPLALEWVAKRKAAAEPPPPRDAGSGK